MSDLLGGKGANLAEMVSLGLPVPPGFTITTGACQVYLESGSQPAELQEQIDTALAELEKSMGQNTGSGRRSATSFSEIRSKIFHARNDGNCVKHRTK